MFSLSPWSFSFATKLFILCIITEISQYIKWAHVHRCPQLWMWQAMKLQRAQFYEQNICKSDHLWREYYYSVGKICIITDCLRWDIILIAINFLFEYWILWSKTKETSASLRKEPVNQTSREWKPIHVTASWNKINENGSSDLQMNHYLFLFIDNIIPWKKKLIKFFAMQSCSLPQSQDALIRAGRLRETFHNH